MNNKIKLFLLVTLLGLTLVVKAQPTAFDYQGKLNDNGVAANGDYDMRFRVFDSATSGNQIGSSVIVVPVAVENGLFTATVDFGAAVFTGPGRWLEIAVRPKGSTAAYATLSPRQDFTSTPYALTAREVTSSNIARLTIPNTAVTATAVPVINSGFITAATLVNGGSGYSSAPPVTVNDTTGSGASLGAHISGGVVTSITVTNPGNGYSPLATISIGPPPSNAYQTFTSHSTFSNGLESYSAAGIPVYASTSTGTGVVGQATSTSGMGGYFRNSFSGNSALLGLQSWAAQFSGNVMVNGTVVKSGGSFKIDHPLDPEKKYLYHSFVESPDMKNIYDGTVQLDVDGSATVTLPAWFGALNRDFRYQLTAIGAPGPNLHIKREVSENRFTIAGGTAAMKVSWQITGTRQDAWANAHRIPVEEDKPADERSTYLAPEEHGQPPTKGLMKARHQQAEQAANSPNFAPKDLNP